MLESQSITIWSSMKLLCFCFFPGIEIFSPILVFLMVFAYWTSASFCLENQEGTYFSASVPNPDQKIAQSLEPCSKISRGLVSTISSSNYLQGNIIQRLGLPAATTTTGLMRTRYSSAIFSYSGESGKPIKFHLWFCTDCMCLYMFCQYQKPVWRWPIFIYRNNSCMSDFYIYICFLVCTSSCIFPLSALFFSY